MTRHHDILGRFGAEAVVRLCGLASFPLLARNLGVDGYGVIIGAGVLSGLAIATAGLGLSFHVGRLLASRNPIEHPAILRSLLMATGVAGASLALLLAVSAPAISAAFLPHIDGTAAVRAVSLGVLAGCSDAVLTEWLRSRRRFSTISLLQVVTAVSQLGAILLVLRLHGGPAAILTAIAGIQAAKLLITFALLRRLGEFAAARCYLAWGETRGLISSSAPVWIATLVGWGMANASRAALGTSMDTTALGCFGAAALIASGIGMIGSACWLPLYPSLARAITHGHPGAATLAARTFGRFFHAIAIPALGLGAVLGGDAIRCLTGAVFPDVSAACAILLVASFVEMAALPWNYAIAAHGDARRALLSLSAGCITGLALALLLTRPYGIVGAAYSVLAAQIVSAAVNIYTVHNVGGHPCRFLPWSQMAAASAATCLAIPIALLLRGDGWGRLLCATSASLTAYVLGLALLRASGRIRI